MARLARKRQRAACVCGILGERSDAPGAEQGNRVVGARAAVSKPETSPWKESGASSKSSLPDPVKSTV